MKIRFSLFHLAAFVGVVSVVLLTCVPHTPRSVRKMKTKLQKLEVGDNLEVVIKTLFESIREPDGGAVDPKLESISYSFKLESGYELLILMNRDVLETKDKMLVGKHSFLEARIIDQDAKIVFEWPKKP